MGAVIFALLGAVIGSFLNVCIDRLPANGSLLRPPSHCPACGRRLGVKDLVPVLSYLWLRGRCRYCRTAIPPRVLWVEIASAAMFGFLYWYFGPGVKLAVLAFYVCVFLVLMVIDIEHGLILNKIVYPMLIIALAISIFIAPSEFIWRGWLPDFLPRWGIVQALTGGVAGLVMFSLIVILSRGGMGWGDVKMAALIGAITGYPVLLPLLLAMVLGGIIAVILLATRIRQRKEGIPFGPFLSLATIITLIWGTEILGWYWGLF